MGKVEVNQELHKRRLRSLEGITSLRHPCKCISSTRKPYHEMFSRPRPEAFNRERSLWLADGLIASGAEHSADDIRP